MRHQRLDAVDQLRDDEQTDRGDDQNEKQVGEKDAEHTPRNVVANAVKHPFFKEVENGIGKVGNGCAADDGGKHTKHALKPSGDCGEITDDVEKEQIKACHGGFPTLNNADAMLEEIASASAQRNSVGGVVECIVYGAPTGVGGSLFSGLEGKISLAVYSIPAVKGVEFGDGFDIATKFGSVANDQLAVDGGKVKILSNHAGGLNGGITNGNPITLRVAFRPTPSIGLPQNTVDLEKMENTTIEIEGRHDSCVAVRAVPVVESAVALALLDAILTENN